MLPVARRRPGLPPATKGSHRYSAQRLVDRASARTIDWLAQGLDKEQTGGVEMLLGSLLAHDALNIEREWAVLPQYTEDVQAELADRIMLQLISELPNDLP